MATALLKAVLAVRDPLMKHPIARRTLSYLGGTSVGRRALPFPSQSVRITPTAPISTSKKNKDAVTVTDKVHHDEQVSKTTENIEEKEENWMSFGYSLTDREEDEWAHHLLMFSGITIALCWGTFFVAYYPDFKDHAWAQREAYLELERRQSASLPLIDANLIDPANIDLPADDELADFEIII